ncbi:MAG: DUF3810 domain-containing protein [Vicinamibacterales bacterium]|nr:DUF3810 domain-containing protein [Vicinamibacterales bacterium]
MRRAFRFLLPLLALAIAATPLPRATVERLYTGGVYATIQPPLTAAANASRFAWFDLALVLVVVVAIALPIVRLRKPARGWLRAVNALAFDLAAIAAVVYLWFLAVWGLNYQREPLRSQLDFQETRITRESLRALVARDVEFLNSHHAEAHGRPWADYDAMPNVLQPAFFQAQTALGMRWQATPGRPKRSVVDLYFRRASIDGMTDPFFLETLTNQSLLPFERAFVVAHEWSHLAGYADESEANFVAWLVCMRAPVAEQYSAWLSLYGTLVSALPPSDRAEAARSLGPGPRADLQAIMERVRQQVSPLANRAGNAVYDKFLKANRVEAGIGSYGEVVQLLLGTRFTGDGSPVLRDH